MQFILCEDTRQTQKLKNHFELKARLISFHEHNEKTRIPQILKRIEEGKTFALVSDAGTPVLSDPGLQLVRELYSRQIPFTFVPGPSAAVTALILSGFAAMPFAFHGFLPRADSARKKKLERLALLEDHTLILFESPDRVLGLIREIGESLGDRPVAICRELTKVHEEVLRGKVSELLPRLAARKLRGEFTIVVAPGELRPAVMQESTIRARFIELQKEGLSRKEALKKLSKESGRPKGELYDLLMK